MILGKDELQNAENNRLVKISNRGEFSAFSLDIKIDKLYRMRQGIDYDSTSELSQEEFIKEALDEICIDNGYTVNSHTHHLWQPVEDIFLSKDYRGIITSRSSWARFGIASRAISDEYLRDISQDRSFKPLCTVESFGTDVLIKRNDAFTQLFIDDGNNGKVGTDEVKYLIDSGAYVIKSKERTLLYENIKRSKESEGGNIILTMDSKIKVYNGKTIIPGVNNEECFDTIMLKPGKAFFLKKGTFFLSSSAEYVEIPHRYVGLVTEVAMYRNSEQFSTKPTGFPLPFRTHPNALYIAPSNIFKGKITFENMMKWDSYIYPGMKQSELYIERLNTQNHDQMPSRYMGQKQATGSRL
jgi:deoxycytidine triphosphate deaminase